MWLQFNPNTTKKQNKEIQLTGHTVTVTSVYYGTMWPVLSKAPHYT